MEQVAAFFEHFHPVVQALLATLFTWGVTALGSAAVFSFKSIDRKLLDISFGFAGGVMVAASFWSLLDPAIEMSEGSFVPAWVPASVGFFLGALFLYSLDKVLPHLHFYKRQPEEEGIKTQWQRSALLVLAITLHNIPEGLAVGVAFGGAYAGLSETTVTSAVVLAFGIGLQNFPEGLAISFPLRGAGMSRFKSFWYGQLSGIVEPIAGVIGAAAVLSMEPILPYALAFAAGAMIYVVVEEVVPESQGGGNTDLATMGTILGFMVMMILDVALA